MIASTRTFPGLWGCASSCSECCLVRPRVSSSLSVPRGHLLTRHPEGSPMASPCQAPPSWPPHQWWSVSALMLSTAGNQNTMCVNIKSCHLFTLQTSGSRKRKSQLSFHLKKKKNWHNVQALVAWNQPVINSQEMPDPEVLTAIINCENCKNGNKK